MNFSQSFQNMFDTVARVLPQILVFLVVLVVGWFVARMIRNVVHRLLAKVGFDKLTERGVVGDGLRRSDYTASGLLGSLAYYAILLITLQLAFGVFGTNPISTMLTSIVGWIPKAIVAIVLVVVAAAIASVVKKLIEAALGNLSYGRLLANIASVFIIALGVIAALEQVGIATAITGPILVAVLATVGAVIAIGVGGGLVRPMQERWERMLNVAEQESGKIRSGAHQRGREDAVRGDQVPSETSWQTDQTIK